MEAANTFCEVFEALEGLSLPLVKNRVPEFLPDARQEVQLVKPQRDWLGIVVEVDKPLFVCVDDLLNCVVKFRAGAARDIFELDFRHTAKLRQVDAVTERDVNVFVVEL